MKRRDLLNINGYSRVCGSAQSRADSIYDDVVVGGGRVEGLEDFADGFIEKVREEGGVVNNLGGVRTLLTRYVPSMIICEFHDGLIIIQCHAPEGMRDIGSDEGIPSVEFISTDRHTIHNKESGYAEFEDRIGVGFDESIRHVAMRCDAMHSGESWNVCTWEVRDRELSKYITPPHQKGAPSPLFQTGGSRKARKMTQGGGDARAWMQARKTKKKRENGLLTRVAALARRRC